MYIILCDKIYVSSYSKLFTHMVQQRQTYFYSCKGSETLQGVRGNVCHKEEK